ncbi:retinol-binding protein pinta-like isoform X1 [Diorhabda carinulata]|uniref:retinol-binding protein pinta-like isoform X1 n=1 Tax=Diorhabda carinulata TaxID=1163345 RepID=UPI0025A1CF4A|nr:retinol-binding protein pinta-like isoform X1 [Diorhabda carinulata]
MAGDLLQSSIEKVLKIFEMSEADLMQDICQIRDWFRKQRHIPEIPSNSLIQHFLIMNKFSIEKTKKKLDFYYSIRTMIPEIFQNKNPKLPHMQEITKFAYCVPLPKLTEDLYRVNIFKIIGEPKHLNVYNVLAHQLNIIEVKCHEELSMGDVLIIDLQDVTMGHFVKVTPQHIRKANLILENVYSTRLKQIHLVYPSPCIDMLVTLLKSVLKPKLFARIQVHPSAESLLKQIPADILTKDYGGNEPSLDHFQELWKQKLHQYSDRFDKLDSMKVNEKLRPAPLKNDDVLGYYGNFKSLNID